MNVDWEKSLKTWDENCIIRAKDIESGADKTYNHVIIPYVLNVLHAYAKENDLIIDLGCGCGFLTSKISVLYKVEGMDISQIAIDYATKQYPHISFKQNDICSSEIKKMYNFAIANMVMNNLPNLKTFLLNANKMLCEGGKLLVIIPHPCYWAADKLANNNFIYGVAQEYSMKFKTHNNNNYKDKILYYHRPLEEYINTIIQTGFTIIKFDEIYEHWKDKKQCEVPHILGLLLEPVHEAHELINYFK